MLSKLLSGQVNKISAQMLDSTVGLMHL